MMKKGRFKIAYAKEIGTYHMTADLPCQDYVYGCYGENCAVVALADGAGSYEKSEIASRAVVTALITSICENFDYWYYEEESLIKNYLMDITQKAVLDEDDEVIPSTTFMAYAISNDDREIIIHIGDGYIIGVDYGGFATALSYPENGDEPNQTYFLSDVDAKEHLRISRGLGIDTKGVMLASDGAATSLVDRSNDRYASAIYKMMQMVENTEERIASNILGKELNELFRLHTPDDMSIGVLVKTTD